jgi:hypothetical protein
VLAGVAVMCHLWFVSEILLARGGRRGLAWRRCHLHASRVQWLRGSDRYCSLDEELNAQLERVPEQGSHATGQVKSQRMPGAITSSCSPYKLSKRSVSRARSLRRLTLRRAVPAQTQSLKRFQAAAGLDALFLTVVNVYSMQLPSVLVDGPGARLGDALAQR